MSVVTYWKSLTSVALLGTERQNVPTLQGTVLDGLLQEGRSKDETLLDAAAMVSLYLRSGWQTAQTQAPALEVAPADILPTLSKEMQECFIEIMRQDSSHVALKPELFRLMAKAKVRGERGWVHKILEEARRNPVLRTDALAIIDERGRWLAQYIPVGDWVVPPVLPDNMWDEGKLNERAAFLRQLRNTDPARARNLLEESWNGEASDSRADLLSAFEVNLSLDDQTFLEKALDDKRKEVRKTAATLLNTLPSSKLVQRMTERAKKFFNYKPAAMLGLKKAEVEINLPNTFEKDWARDGIEQKNVPYSLGEKAWWVKQILERVSPSVWGQAKDLIAVQSKEWKDLLMDAWYEAALRFKDLAWIEVMLNYRASPQYAMQMVAHLSDETLQRITLERFRSLQGPLAADSFEWELLKACPQPWPPDLLEAVCKRIQLSLLNWSKIQNSYPYREQAALQSFGIYLPVETLQTISEAVKQNYAQANHPLKEALDNMLSTLEMRQKMHRAFKERV